MRRLRIFISSVQAEFAAERQELYYYLSSDALLGKFFEPFLFENEPASEHHAVSVYLQEVEHCDIYICLLGKTYGYVNEQGISPTEVEFDLARSLHKPLLVFLTSHDTAERHPKTVALIRKAEQAIVRKKFSTIHDLKSAVYAALVRYLEENEYIRTVPFDTSSHPSATLADIDVAKVQAFVEAARAKRNFPLLPSSPLETVLTHLHLIEKERLCNAALLLFGKAPQRFFISSEVRCAHFHGTEVVKPIPSYQVYKGDVFQLVDQAIDFVLSKINVSVGVRDQSNQAPIDYELPRAAVAEAIVNAIAHRDYTSNGSVQVMLFKDRLEIWNPGRLPFGLTIAKLKEPHHSIPTNPLLAEPMYLSGYIERMGTGTGDILRLCKNKNLKEPEFIQEEFFKTIIWRITPQATPQVTEQATEQVTEQVTPQATPQVTPQVTPQPNESVLRVILVIENEMKREDIQGLLGLRDRKNFVENYLNPALEEGVIRLKYPDSPNHPQQRYLLTEKGLKLKEATHEN